MQIIGTEIIESPQPQTAFIVEFLGDGGEKVSVHMAETENGGLTRDNAVHKAQVLLLQASRFGLSDQADDDETADKEPSAAVESLRQEQQERKVDERNGSALQEGLEDTYPASDPVSATYTSTIGEQKH